MPKKNKKKRKPHNLDKRKQRMDQKTLQNLTRAAQGQQQPQRPPTLGERRVQLEQQLAQGESHVKQVQAQFTATYVQYASQVAFELFKNGTPTDECLSKGKEFAEAVRSYMKAYEQELLPEAPIDERLLDQMQQVQMEIDKVEQQLIAAQQEAAEKAAASPVQEAPKLVSVVSTNPAANGEDDKPAA